MFLTRQLLHQKTLTQETVYAAKKNLYTRSLLYESWTYTWNILHQTTSITECKYIRQRVLMPNGCFTKRLLHQNMFTTKFLHQKCTLLQVHFTPKFLYTKRLYTKTILHQKNCWWVHWKTSTQESVYTKNPLHQKQKPFTLNFFSAEASYTQIILCQTTFSPTSLTPETVCTRSLLRQIFYSKQLWHQRASHQTLFSPEPSYTRNIFTPETTAILTPEGRYTRNFVNQKFLTTKPFKTRGAFHQKVFTPEDSCTKKALLRTTTFTAKICKICLHEVHQRTLTPKSFHTRRLFSPEALHTKELLHPHTFYTKAGLYPVHEKAFTPENVYSRNLFRQTTVTPWAFYAQKPSTRRLWAAKRGPGLQTAPRLRRPTQEIRWRDGLRPHQKIYVSPFRRTSTKWRRGPRRAQD